MYDMVYFADTLRVPCMEDDIIEINSRSIDRAYRRCFKTCIIGLRLGGGWTTVRVVSELMNTLSSNLLNVALSLM